MQVSADMAVDLRGGGMKCAPESLSLLWRVERGCVRLCEKKVEQKIPACAKQRETQKGARERARSRKVKSEGFRSREGDVGWEHICVLSGVSSCSVSSFWNLLMVSFNMSSLVPPYSYVSTARRTRRQVGSCGNCAADLCSLICSSMLRIFLECGDCSAALPNASNKGTSLSSACSSIIMSPSSSPPPLSCSTVGRLFPVMRRDGQLGVF
eukprot:919259-Rhodomonas_salina.2